MHASHCTMQHAKTNKNHSRFKNNLSTVVCTRLAEVVWNCVNDKHSFFFWLHIQSPDHFHDAANNHKIFIFIFSSLLNDRINAYTNNSVSILS